MKNRNYLFGLIAGMSAAIAADAPSPARLQMNGFLTAFNSGDRTSIEAFGREHMPPDFMRREIIDHTLDMRAATGGFDVVDVAETGPLALEGHVRERRTQQIQVIVVAVDAAAPERITEIWFRLPEPADEAAQPATR